MLLFQLPLSHTLDLSSTPSETDSGENSGSQTSLKRRFRLLMVLIHLWCFQTNLCKPCGLSKNSQQIEFHLKTLLLLYPAADTLWLLILNFKVSDGLKEKKALPCNSSNCRKTNGWSVLSWLSLPARFLWLKQSVKISMPSLIHFYPVPLSREARTNSLNLELKKSKLPQALSFTYRQSSLILTINQRQLLSAQSLTSLLQKKVLKTNFLQVSCVLKNQNLNKRRNSWLQCKTNSWLLLPSSRKIYCRNCQTLIQTQFWKTHLWLKVLNRQRRPPEKFRDNKPQLWSLKRTLTSLEKSTEWLQLKELCFISCLLLFALSITCISILLKHSRHSSSRLLIKHLKMMMKLQEVSLWDNRSESRSINGSLVDSLSATNKFSWPSWPSAWCKRRLSQLITLKIKWTFWLIAQWRLTPHNQTHKRNGLQMVPGDQFLNWLKLKDLSRLVTLLEKKLPNVLKIGTTKTGQKKCLSQVTTEV